MTVRWGVEPSWKLWLGAWLWVLMVGAGLQFYILPATPWHAGYCLRAPSIEQAQGQGKKK